VSQWTGTLLFQPFPHQHHTAQLRVAFSDVKPCVSAQLSPFVLYSVALGLSSINPFLLCPWVLVGCRSRLAGWEKSRDSHSSLPAGASSLTAILLQSGASSPAMEQWLHQWPFSQHLLSHFHHVLLRDTGPSWASSGLSLLSAPSSEVWAQILQSPQSSVDPNSNCFALILIPVSGQFCHCLRDTSLYPPALYLLTQQLYTQLKYRVWVLSLSCALYSKLDPWEGSLPSSFFFLKMILPLLGPSWPTWNVLDFLVMCS
jgi:hypothetical protein